MIKTDAKNRLSDFDYELPEALIAEYPPEKRPEARLMKISRKTGAIEHHRFHEIESLLRPGDVLVLNDTKVIPARLLGVRKTGGKIEALLLQEFEDGTWDALIKPSSRVSPGDKVCFEGEGEILEGEVLDGPRAGSGARRIRFLGPEVKAKIWKTGRMPLPPYIRREDKPSDRRDYQTVFARAEGAIAAPTAGLHFDEALLEKLKQRGIEIAMVTLHTGYGTFQPVNTENILEHRMFEERFEISPETAACINRAKQEDRRVIACGTTSVRALESAAGKDGRVSPQKAQTGLFIHPPFEFKVTDAMITNFHLPKSTLLMLVSALMGYEAMREAYRVAVSERYRFYSYGDAMLIL